MLPAPYGGGQAWYDAMSRLNGYTAFENWAAHYPGQANPGNSVLLEMRCKQVSARCRALGITFVEILEEMKKGPRTLYAAAFRDQHGDLGFYFGPNPSLQFVREYGTPPDYTPVGAKTYIVKLEGDTVTPVARWVWDLECPGEGSWQRKKEKQ